jgi:DNA-nicking Smr family endonuclease
MAKKKPQQPPRPQEFHSAPFASLKGVPVVANEPASRLQIPVAPLAPAPIDDGAELFQRAMDGVRKLGVQPVKGHVPEEKTETSTGAGSKKSKKAESAAPDPATSDLFLQEIGRLKLEVKFTEQIPDEDELKQLSGNRLKQLKRGIISVNYQLDLHGLTREEALAELPRFLRSARSKGQAAALVITGKGNNSPGEPVLQQAVAGWLRDAGREQILEYAPAPREMGGSGAFVVFLRPPAKPVEPPLPAPHSD